MKNYLELYYGIAIIAIGAIIATYLYFNVLSFQPPTPQVIGEEIKRMWWEIISYRIDKDSNIIEIYLKPSDYVNLSKLKVYINGKPAQIFAIGPINNGILDPYKGGFIRVVSNYSEIQYLSGKAIDVIVSDPYYAILYIQPPYNPPIASKYTPIWGFCIANFTIIDNLNINYTLVALYSNSKYSNYITVYNVSLNVSMPSDTINVYTSNLTNMYCYGNPNNFVVYCNNTYNIQIYCCYLSWLSGWQYRIPITIQNQVNQNLTNYQVLVTLDTSTLISQGKMRSDCGDMRFTYVNSTGEYEITYWIEPYTCNTTSTRIWVKVPYIPANGSSTIYMYYGNPTATSKSNAGELDIWQLREFDLFSAYDPNIIFSKSDVSVLRIDSYTGGASSMGRGYVFIELPKTWLHGKIVSITWRGYFSFSSSRQIGGLYVFNESFSRRDFTKYMVPNSNIEGIFNVAYITLATYSCAGGWCSWVTSTSSTLDLTGYKDYVTLLVRLDDDWSGQTVILDIDRIVIYNPDGSIFRIFDFNDSVVMEVAGTLNDYGFYRKYVSPEPLVYLGNEQKQCIS